MIPSCNSIKVPRMREYILYVSLIALQWNLNVLILQIPKCNPTTLNTKVISLLLFILIDFLSKGVGEDAQSFSKLKFDELAHRAKDMLKSI